MNQPGQDDGLPGMHVDNGVGLAGQKRRIALDGERRVDLADLGFDTGQNVALGIDIRLDIELDAVVLVRHRDRPKARAHRYGDLPID